MTTELSGRAPAPATPVPDEVAARLDAPAARAQVDPADALGDVEGAPERWRAAGELPLPPLDLSGSRAVVIAGVGGSGVAGDVVAALASAEVSVPVTVHKTDRVPRWIGAGVTVVCCSYSGRTAETLAVARAADDAGAHVITLSSGGPLAELAADRGLTAVRVPGGPPPRHALGWLVVPLLRLLGVGGCLDEAVAGMRRVVDAWDRDVPLERNPGKQLAASLAGGCVPVVFGGPDLAAVAAARLKTQLNENAKLPAHAAALPELAHHEIMGWEGPGPLDGAARLVWMRDPAGEPADVAASIERIDALLASRVGGSQRLDGHGDAPESRLATLLAQADLVSVYTALARGIDPSPIAAIDALKRGTSHAG